LSGERAELLSRLTARRYDLLVIGGGIIGAGTAAAAVRQGLSVALVDRGDFAGATSSASSKLIHGGLRYLRLGDVALVHEAQSERRLLMGTVAPHLVRELPFLVPVYRGGPYRPLTLGAGLALYSALARTRPRRGLSGARARALAPALRLGGLRACGVYSDCITNDARLTLANVWAAERGGAVVANYAEVLELRRRAGRVSGAELLCDGQFVSVEARAVVNATGPWLDELRRLEDPGCAASIRLSKGVHVVLEPAAPWAAALAIPHDPVRFSFALPWQGMLLLGTTDELYEGEAGALRVEPHEVDQVLAEAGAALEPGALERSRVRASFAGLRVLPFAEGSTASARRETLYLRGRGGMLSVAGGKLTTYRRIALRALEHLRGDLGLAPLASAAEPLPDGRPADTRRLRSLPEATRSLLLELYGARAGEVVALADGQPELLEPLTPGQPELAVQVVYAARREWALTVEDVLRRRTTLALRGHDGPALRRRVSELLELAPSAAGLAREE
jgi:glycerol-3-phosphate dehydrogenase